MKRLRKAGCIGLAALMMTTALSGYMTPVRAEETAAAGEEAASYARYAAAYAEAAHPQRQIRISAAAGYLPDGDIETAVIGNEQGGAPTEERAYLLTGDTGGIAWPFSVEETGWYALRIAYYPVVDIGHFKGKSVSAQRTLYLDGQIPYSECEGLEFERIWEDDLETAGQFRTDAAGNQIKPSQVEKPRWVEKYVQDAQGYVGGDLYFYLTAGDHTLRLESLREPLLLDTLTFAQVPEAAPEEPECEPLSNTEILIQGEAANRKSDQVLVPRSDRSSSQMEPYSLTDTVLNYIGGSSWSRNGQWIEWDFEVEKAGYYCLDIKYKQQEKRGLYSSRRILLDGQTPYRDWEEVPFSYASGWQMKRLTDTGGRPRQVYLREGKHTIRLENTLGSVRKIANQVADSAAVLSEVYRRVLMVVGNNPDTYRDYQIVKQFPRLRQTLTEQAELLQRQTDELAALVGEKSSLTSVLSKVVLQLEQLARDPEKIAKKGNFDALKTNVGSLSSWVQEVAQQPLGIDYIRFCSPDMQPKAAQANIFKRLWDYIQQIAVTYVKDYSTLSGKGTGESITVWYGSGRDQANIIKSLIDDGFTPDSGIQVDLKLIDPANVLMSAIISGQAPDVAMGIVKGTPINYALRGAVSDLSGFSGFEEVERRFRDSALTPYRWDGGTYALPETETYFMMFYREDILREMQLPVPETWEDIEQAVTVLQRYNLEVALPDPSTTAADLLFAMFLYQNGGAFYNKTATASALTSAQGLNAFKKWTDYYTLLSFPVSYDAASRFRRGEIPIMIADYSLYNTLVVSAPEIAGKWDMAPIPGTKREDGGLDRSVASNSTACILLSQSKNKEAAWKYMSWWVSRDTQTLYGKELESVLGEAARYATANIEAQESIAWSSKALRSLQQQGQWVTGIPEVPGGYFTPRHLENAFRFVTNNNANARDALVDYACYIDDEITQKRKEFHLD